MRIRMSRPVRYKMGFCRYCKDVIWLAHNELEYMERGIFAGMMFWHEIDCMKKSESKEVTDVQGGLHHKDHFQTD